MSCLHYRNTDLYIENVSLKTIAQKFDTPCYIYSQHALKTNWLAFDRAFQPLPHLICYAVKANSNIALLKVLAELNSGFDIVSVGELERVIIAGGDPGKIVFSGVGKKHIEIEQAIKKGIYCFDVESTAELERLQTIAKSLQKKVNIALRINPNVDPRTHSYISTGLKENKFGIDIDEVISVCDLLASMPQLQLIGIACHIGSQLTEMAPFLLALDRLLEIHLQLKKMGINIQHLNIGGGLGICYHDETPPSITEYANALQKKMHNTGLELIIEPGRAIVGNTGILLTRIEYLKHSHFKNFAVIDAGMNDFLRPALYNAWQQILPVELRALEEKIYDIAGPVCESSDFLGKDRRLAVLSGDLLAVDAVGAYGFSMSSNYNSRCRPAEILVDKDTMRLIRRRETLAELLAAETR